MRTPILQSKSPEMNPQHQHMAKEECQELEQQGLIEKITSPWACHGFYINKRSEQTRGNRRLVINYKPLNEFFFFCK